MRRRLPACTVRHVTCSRAATMNTIRNMFAFSLATAGVLLACGGANQETAPVSGTQTIQTGATSAQKGADQAIVNQLATARCDQEHTCGNIGPGAKFATRDVCMEQLRGSIGNELNAYDCPRGLDSNGVDRCMAAIKSEECNHPFDTLTRYDKCRTGALCLE